LSLEAPYDIFPVFREFMLWKSEFVFVNNTGTLELLIDVRKLKMDCEVEAEELLNKLAIGWLILKMFVAIELPGKGFVYSGFIYWPEEIGFSFMKLNWDSTFELFI